MRTDERILGEEERTATKIPHTLSATTIIGDPVVNEYGEDLGKIEELMIDLDHGRVAYAVLSFGGLFGIGCVGDVHSFGTSVCGTGLSVQPNTGRPLVRSKAYAMACFVSCTTARTGFPSTVRLSRIGCGGMS